MTELEIFQAIDLMISCLPEDRQSVIDMIRNSEEIREFIIEVARDTLETAIEKLKVALEKIAEREPRIHEIKDVAVTIVAGTPRVSATVEAIPPED